MDLRLRGLVRAGLMLGASWCFACSDGSAGGRSTEEDAVDNDDEPPNEDESDIEEDGDDAPPANGRTMDAGQTGEAGSRGMDAAVRDASGSAQEAAVDSATVADAAAGLDARATSDSAPTSPPASGGFPAVDDLTAEGPYRAVTVNDSGPNNAYTVFHPAELAPDGVRNPFLTWGNGILTTPDWYTLLPHLASHGFVVIASNSSNVTPEDLRAGLDWLFAENEREGSTFFEKLDTTNVASMGYSLGSNGTFQIADDPRLKTTVHISGGAFDKADTARLRNPAAFLCGAAGGDGYTTGDVARENCDSDFEAATVPVFYGVFNEGGHLGVILSPHMERIRNAVTGWLRWQLMADETLHDMFVGDDCTLCVDPNWTVQQKNL